MSDLSGYTAMCEQFDAEEISEIMGVIKREGTAVIESFGGTVNQFKGDEIVSLFGVPTAADDDARRAVAAALALHAKVADLNDSLVPRPPVKLSMHTGVFTGRVVLVTDDARDGVYGVTGDAINTAARVLGLAERDELIIGETTRAAVAPYFDLEFAGSHTVRNKAEPLDVHRVLAERQDVTRFDASVERGLTTLAGRSDELAHLRTALGHAAGGRPRLIVVEADAGTGKSRLSFEFAQQARATERDLTIVKGRCQSFGSAIPYLPFQQVVREVLGLDTTTATERAVTDRLEEIDPDLVRFGPGYRHLIGALPAGDLPLEWQGDILPDVLADALTALVDGVSRRQTTILQLDDWHWTDVASHRVLCHLAAQRTDARVLIVVSQRPGAPALPEQYVESVIELPPLGLDGTEAMIAAWFGVQAVQPELTRTVHERTAGNPLFVEEVCAALSSDGRSQVVHDTVVIADGVDELVLPDTVQAVVLGRIDALDQTSRDVLRIASVIGREFDETLVAELVGPAAADVALPVLTRARFIEPMTPGRHRFRHIITRDVTYESLLVRERHTYHARIADLLEAEQVDVEPHDRRKVELIAHHHQRAGNAERAMAHFEVAGRRAVERRALAEARHMLEAAIDESRKIDQTIDVRNQRGRLALEWAAACIFLPSRVQIELLESVFDEAVADLNIPVAVRTRYWISWIRFSIGDQFDAERDTRELLETLGDSGGGFASVLHCHLGQILHVQERHVEAQAEIRLGLPADFLTGDAVPARLTGMQCFSLAQLALDTADMGSFDESDRLMSRALDLVRMTPERSTEASIMVCVALRAIAAHDWDGALRSIAAIDSLPPASVSPFVRINMTCIEGHARVRQGSVDEGLGLLRRGVAAHESSEAHLTLAMTRAWLADALSLAGQVDDAVSVARAALSRRHTGDMYRLSIADEVLVRHGQEPELHP
jgi:class 3 adenylate cyclase